MNPSFVYGERTRPERFTLNGLTASGLAVNGFILSGLTASGFILSGLTASGFFASLRMTLNR